MTSSFVLFKRAVLWIIVGVIYVWPLPSRGGAETNVVAEVRELVHETAERWNSQDFSTVLGLWDEDQTVPFYLAEEQDDWFTSWETLRSYLDPPRPNTMIEGLREEMYAIHVKQIAPDLAIAAWHMHFEMKFRGRPAIGEDVRVSAVLRRKPEGWRYIHWAESPMTTLSYIDKLFERDVDHDKFNVVLERTKRLRAASQ